MNGRIVSRVGFGLLIVFMVLTLLRLVLLARSVETGVVAITVVVLGGGLAVVVFVLIRRARRVAVDMVAAQEEIARIHGVDTVAAYARDQNRPTLARVVFSATGFSGRWFLVSLEPGRLRFWAPEVPPRVVGDIPAERIGAVAIWTEMLSGFEHHRLGVEVDGTRLDLVLARLKGRALVMATPETFDRARAGLEHVVRRTW